MANGSPCKPAILAYYIESIFMLTLPLTLGVRSQLHESVLTLQFVARGQLFPAITVTKASLWKGSFAARLGRHTPVRPAGAFWVCGPVSLVICRWMGQVTSQRPRYLAPQARLGTVSAERKQAVAWRRVSLRPSEPQAVSWAVSFGVTPSQKTSRRSSSVVSRPPPPWPHHHPALPLSQYPPPAGSLRCIWGMDSGSCPCCPTQQDLIPGPPLIPRSSRSFSPCWIPLTASQPGDGGRERRGWGSVRRGGREEE